MEVVGLILKIQLLLELMALKICDICSETLHFRHLRLF
jgi:hypothetical protein